MPTKLFNELDDVKKKRITEAAINEFAVYGYENGSTNRIVKDCGISKGSLFKYFENKEELYIYLIETIFFEMSEGIKVDIDRLSKDLFKRVIEYSSAEIAWYISNPIKGRFLIGVASESGSEIGKKIIERYGKKSIDIYEEIIKEADMSLYKNSRKEITDILRWVLTGFNNSFIGSLRDEYKDVDKIKEDYIRQLKIHLKVLKNGL